MIRTVLTGAEGFPGGPRGEVFSGLRDGPRKVAAAHVGEGQGPVSGRAAAGIDHEKVAAGLKNGRGLPEVPLRELSIHVDRELGEVVIQVVNTETRNVLRQIPSEEALKMLRHLSGLKGSLVDTEG